MENVNLEKNENGKDGKKVWPFVLVIVTLLFLSYFYLAFCFHPYHRPRQSEAKTNLASLATASISYYAEKNIWGNSFKLIGWEPQGKTKYTYFLSPSEYIGRPPEELGISIPLTNTYGAPMPGASKEGFTALAIGNIDDDDTLDVWWIDQAKDPRNAQNDVNL